GLLPGLAPHGRGGKQASRSAGGNLSAELVNGTGAILGPDGEEKAGRVSWPVEGAAAAGSAVSSGLVSAPLEGLSGNGRDTLPASTAISGLSQAEHSRAEQEDVGSLAAADLLFGMLEKTESLARARSS